MEKSDSCFIAMEKCPILFILLFLLRSFLIREGRLPLYVVKRTLNISTMFINYQQHVIAVYINYGLRRSKTLGSELRSCGGNGEIRKAHKKSKGAVRRQLSCSSSIRSRFFFITFALLPLSPSRSRNRLAKH